MFPGARFREGQRQIDGDHDHPDHLMAKKAKYMGTKVYPRIRGLRIRNLFMFP